VTYQTVNTYLDLLEDFFLARRLPPFHANLGKRLVKAPRVYLRDSGLLHHLLGIGDADRLSVAPGRGASWEGYVIEQILAREAIDSQATQPCFFRTQAGAEIDLILDRGHERIGFEIKAASSVGAADWRHLQAGVQDGLIQRGVVVHLGDVSFPARENIDVLSAGELLSQGLAPRP
jgi:predicted AAA+ superfamily ATPase